METKARKQVAVVLAGGTGTRTGLEEPKQFFLLAGKTVLEHCVDRFEAFEEIDEIVIVSHKDYRERVELLAQQRQWRKLAAVLLGGKERYDSSLAAIRHYAGQEVNLLFHDAARPLVTARVVQAVCAALEESEAAAAGLPVADTIWEVNEGCVESIPDRSTLWRAQTPQGFRSTVIAAAYEKALADPHFSVTDDCGVLRRYLPKVRIQTVVGAEQTLKLTFPTDIPILEQFLQEETTKQ